MHETEGQQEALSLSNSSSSSSDIVDAGTTKPSPRVRRVPPPRISQLPLPHSTAAIPPRPLVNQAAIDALAQSQQPAQTHPGHARAASASPSLVLGLGLGRAPAAGATDPAGNLAVLPPPSRHHPSASVASMSSMAGSPSQGGIDNGNSPGPHHQAHFMTMSQTTAEMRKVTPPPSTAAAAINATAGNIAVRPTLMSRTSSGGNRIAALASKFGTSAVQKVQAAKQHASAAMATAASSSSAHSSSSNASSTGNEMSLSASSRGLAGAVKDRGANLVTGAAARLTRKGKERSTSASDQQQQQHEGGWSGLGLLPSSASSASGFSPSPSPSSSPNPAASGTFPHPPTAATAGGRRPSISSRVVLGTRIPSNRAGDVFGAPLKVAADRTKLAPGAEVPDLPARYALGEVAAQRRREAVKYLPAIAVRCLDYLNEWGKREEGLYRVPGSSQQVANLRAIFDSGTDVDLLGTLAVSELEPSAVASCFKLWLRELPQSLLQSLERDIDLLLMEHTGNSASTKVMTATTQSAPPLSASLSASSSMSGSSANRASVASPLVVERIRDLFSESLPRENLVLLREIAYHLAHLDSFSSVTKMTFSNLRLILSPTLRLSPVMLSVLVKERDLIFPKPGQLGSTEIGRLSFDFQTIITEDRQPLSLSLPGSTRTGDGNLPALPSRPGTTAGSAPALPPKTSLGSELLPTQQLRAPYSNFESGWSTVSGVSHKTSHGSLHQNYRASWHVVDLPSTHSGPRKSTDTDTDSDAQDAHTATPIARKFLHQRTASASNLLERASSTPPQLTISTASVRTTPPGSSGLSAGSRGTSPFFSSAAAAAQQAAQARKRSSVSSLQSLQDAASARTPIAESTRPSWKMVRKTSSQPRTPQLPHSQQQQVQAQPAPDDEEELSSSDSFSSASSAATPKDSHDVDFDGLDTRRTTITAESYANLVGSGNGARGTEAGWASQSVAAPTPTAVPRNGLRVPMSDETKKKRGSMMLMNLPDMSNWDESDGLLTMEERRRLFEA